MPDAIYPHALTTLERVKDRLRIERDEFDTLLQRLINAATDQIEGPGMCNRRFKETAYTNQLIPVKASAATRLLLPQAPVSALTSLQYRQGIVSAPTWASFTANDYELEGDGSTGVIYMYASLPQGPNLVRATYTAGYKIAWASAGDTSLHTLPADLTDICEQMVAKAYKRRDYPGRTTESTNGSSVTYTTELDKEQKLVLAQYARPSGSIF